MKKRMGVLTVGLRSALKRVLSILKPALTLFCVLAAIAAQAVAVAPAGAHVGSLSFEGCVNDTGAHQCDKVKDGVLTDLTDVAMSPDGQSVYTVANSTLARFTADGQGRLTFQSCISSNLGSLCPKADTDVIRNATAVAISPNGKSIYVTSSGYSSLARFSLGSNGDLIYDDCFSTVDADIFDECTDPAASTLDRAYDVAVNPSSGAVYVAAIGGFTEFSAGAGGALSPYKCYGPGGGCALAPSALQGITVGVSPDGKEVFLTTVQGALTVFSTTSGHLQYVKCVHNTSQYNCLNRIPPELDSAIAVSPDNKSAYVAGDDTYTVSHFSIGTASGAASYDECVWSGSGFATYCATPPVPALKYPQDVAISPDGASLYVASVPEDGGPDESPDQNLSTYLVDGHGRLTFDSCIADDQSDHTCVGLPGRLMPPDPVAPSGLAVSPDGRSVYMTQQETGSLLHFYRQDGSVTTDIRSSAIQQEAQSATFTFGAAGGGKRAGRAAANRFQCALRKGHRKLHFRSCTSPKRYRNLRPARYTFEVRQVDRAFKDRTPAKRRFRIR